jgi:small-conductance mechanosensitive channel
VAVFSRVPKLDEFQAERREQLPGALRVGRFEEDLSMKKPLKVVGAAADGAAAGVALVFVLCIATGLIAILTGSPVSLPGFLAVAAGSENGALALEARPTFAGFAVVVALTMLARMIQFARRRDPATPAPR